MQNDISHEYFTWMKSIVGYNEYTNCEKLLNKLNNIPYRYSVDSDSNRYHDGLMLRDTYAYENGMDRNKEYIFGPPSVLEVLIAFAKRVENEIFADDYGDNTQYWFDLFILNLGISRYNDSNFDEEKVENSIDKFLDREYAYSGKGGILHIYDSPVDFTKIGLWEQMSWYSSRYFGD